jgi:hypothetical protein
MSFTATIIGDLKADAGKENEIVKDILDLLERRNLDTATIVGDTINIVLKPVAAAVEAAGESVAGPVGESLAADAVHAVETEVEKIV